MNSKTLSSWDVILFYLFIIFYKTIKENKKKYE